MRQAADELRAELAGETVTFVVNRNINVSNVCIVGCAFCGFGQGKRSPDAYEHDEAEFARARRTRRSSSARPRSACSRASTRTGRSRTTCTGCASPRTTAPQIHLHAYSPMEVAHMCDISGLRAGRRCSRGCARPGSARRPAPPPRCSHDGVRERISPNKLPVARWVEIIEASHARRAALDRRR